jgi:hypothetical protein
MTSKILKTALLLARYQTVVGDLQRAYDKVELTTIQRDRIRRELIAMVGEAELMDILQEEPTDVENPAHG